MNGCNMENKIEDAKRDQAEDQNLSEFRAPRTFFGSLFILASICSVFIFYFLIAILSSWMSSHHGTRYEIFQLILVVFSLISVILPLIIGVTLLRQRTQKVDNCIKRAIYLYLINFLLMIFFFGWGAGWLLYPK